MTGGEEAAAAAAKAAKRALSEDESTKAQLARMAEDTPEMRAAAEARAKQVVIRQHLVLKLMEPLGRMAGFSKDYFENTFADDLAEKMTTVPEEEVQSPASNVAVPAMQALGYSLDEPTLKDMYLNLLANASDKRAGSETHPAFAQVVKELSSAEAAHLGDFLQEQNQPCIRLKLVHPDGGIVYMDRFVVNRRSGTGAEPAVEPRHEAWVDNWVRLGLVEVKYDSYLAGEGFYDWAADCPEIRQLRGRHSARVEVDFDKGTIASTAFGRRFARAVGLHDK